jgi:hypothetical protein
LTAIDLRGRFLAALLALLAHAADPERDAVADERPLGVPSDLLDIEGNLVLVDEVYLAVLDLPAEARPNPETARSVKRQLLSFLRRAGYALASVDAVATGGRIRVTIDEGRLATIVVRGRDTVSTLAVRLGIKLPWDVFNRPQLERMLEPYRNEGARVTYALVPVRAVNHVGPQVDPLQLLPGSEPQPERGAYELRIEFTGTPRSGGVTVVAGIDPDSIRGGVGYSLPSVVLADDRLELQTQAGANYFEDLERETDELHFSRAFVQGRWLSPTVLGDLLRPTLRVREDLLRRQRQDLLVETYWWNRLEGALGLTVEPWNGTQLTAEVGVQQRDLFAVDQLEGTPDIPRVEPSSTLLGFAGLSGRIVFDPDELRLDRRHRFEFDVRRYGGTGSRSFWSFDAEYKKVFAFGWNDLFLRGTVGGVASNYGIADAVPMTGHFLRGVFGHTVYLDQAAALGLEYRLSLLRDVFKVGVFHEGAVFREDRVANPTHDYSVGNSFGPSFHALVMDVLQFNLYYAVGFTSEGDFDHGVSLQLEKAF